MTIEKSTGKTKHETLPEKLLGVTKGVLSVTSFQPILVSVRQVNENNVLLGISSPLSLSADSMNSSVPDGRFTVSGGCVFEAAPPIEITGEVTFTPHHNAVVLVPKDSPECVKVIQRREAYRVEAVRKVSFLLDDGTLMHGNVVNLSIKGFRAVISAGVLEPKKYYPVTVELDESHKIDCVACMVHTCNRNARGKQCMAGFAFAAMTPDTLKALREFVMNTQRKNIFAQKKEKQRQG